MRIGIDLGGTKIEGIVLSANGEVIHKHRLNTPAESYTQTVETLCELVEVLQSKTRSRLTVGIGTPGSLSMPSGLMKNSNSVRLNGKPLKQDIESRLGYAVRIENDANCFALSEAHLGAGKDADTVFGVILGTGCGGGVVIGKRLLNGPNSIAGEWGHNALPSTARALIESDRQCYCGRINCIETVLSGRGLAATHKERFGDDFDAARIAALAEENSEAAIECIEIYSRQLACCLGTVVNIIDPHMIVLGGGLSNIRRLYSRVPELLQEYVFTDRLQTILSPPSFGDASGALGAACLWPAGDE